MSVNDWIEEICARLQEEEGPEKARQVLSCVRDPSLHQEMVKLIEAVEHGRTNKLTRKWLG